VFLRGEESQAAPSLSLSGNLRVIGLPSSAMVIVSSLPLQVSEVMPPVIVFCPYRCCPVITAISV
jgi:hypothetical protein